MRISGVGERAISATVAAGSDADTACVRNSAFAFTFNHGADSEVSALGNGPGRGSLVNSSTTRTGGGKTGIIYSARIVPSRQPVLRYPSTAACGPHAASAGKALPDKSDLRRNSFARIRRRSKRVLRILYAFHYRVDMFGNPSPKYAHIVASSADRNTLLFCT